MRKGKILVAMLLLLAGCTTKPNKDDLLLQKYKAAYNDLVSNDKFLSDSSYYDLEVVVNKIENNKYRVDAIIDNPKVAMYNIQVIAELDSIGVEQFDKVIPSLGIVDQSVYHLIPFQVNKDEGFYGGLVVSGVSDKAQGTIIIEIAWTDYSETVSYQEFLKFNYDIEPELPEEENTEEDLESDDE
ncbi:MAG: hypothetical protein GX769_04835 [Erysipelothrix sp.]|nr:hypothetical protein [Erysipelothrix sp.]